MEKATELLHQGTAQVGDNPWIWVVIAVVIAVGVFWVFTHKRNSTDTKATSEKFFND